MVHLSELSWDELLATDNPDLIWPQDHQTENEIIRRCPEFATLYQILSTHLFLQASEYGYVDIVKVLLAKDAGLCHLSDPLGRSPLDYAAKTGKMEVIDILLQTMHTCQIEAETVKLLVENALLIAIAGNQREAFRVLAYKYMEDWDSNKVASIKTTNKLLLQANGGVQDPRMSEVVQIMGIQELNKLLMVACKEYSLRRQKEQNDLRVNAKELEGLLNKYPLLFETVSSPRSCPLETQLYLTILTKETDDLVKHIMRRRKPELFEPSYYPLHEASGSGYIKTVRLMLSQVSCTSTACSQKSKSRGDTPLHHAVSNFGTNEVIRILLSTSWDCVGAVTDDRRNPALFLAARLKRYSPFKILLEYHIIKDELLDNNNVNYWKGGKFVLEIADRFVHIVKELLSQSDCKVCFVEYKDNENWKGCMEAVINGKLTDNILDVVQDVEKEKNGPLVHLSYYRKSITLKVLLRHPRIREILEIQGQYGYPNLLNTLSKPDSRNTNLMGLLLTWEYERYHQAILLVDAIQMGDFEGYMELLSLYPDILDRVSEFPLGGTPLHISIKAGKGKLTTFIKDIIRTRPDFAHCPNRNGFTPLHVASAKDYLDIVKELIAQVGPHLCFLNRYPSSWRSCDDLDDSTDDDKGRKEQEILDYDEDNSLFSDACCFVVKTPLHCAINNHRISVINELLPIWWNSSTGMALKGRDISLLRSVLSPGEGGYSEAGTMLILRYIEDQLLCSEDWDTNAASELSSGYIQIMKLLVNPNTSCHLSLVFVDKTEEDKNINGVYNHCSAVIEVKCGTINLLNGENYNVYNKLTTSYLKYFQEVTSTQRKRILNLWLDKQKSIIIMEIWMRSPLFYTEDKDGRTVRDSLWNCKEKGGGKDEFGNVIPLHITIWDDEIHNGDTSSSEDDSIDGNEETSENAEVDGVQNTSEKCVCPESFSEMPSDQVQLPDAEEDNNREVHEQDLPGVNVSDNPIGVNSTMNDQRLFLNSGQMFESASKCRHAIKTASILAKKVVGFEKSTRTRIFAMCYYNKSCQWSLSANVEGDGKSFKVRKMVSKHTCPCLDDSKNKLATPEWISDCVVDYIWPDKNAFFKLNEMRIVSFIKDNYQIDIEATPASKAKKLAIEKIHHLQLQDYIARVLQPNPDSIASLTSKNDREFEGLFISYKACMNGFLRGCLPLVFFEKIPTEKGDGGNNLLAAIGVDGNKNMFPFAFALLNKKTELKDAWELFFDHLDYIVKHPGFKQMNIISNPSYELTEAIEGKFPRAVQGPFAWHLSLEMQNKFGSNIDMCCQQIAMALTTEEYNKAFADLKFGNEEAAEWLVENLPRNWVTSKFLPARISPLPAMLEQISICLRRMFDERRDKSTINSPSCLTQYADERIKAADEASRTHTVLPPKHSIYEVQDSNNNMNYDIDLLKKSCTCLHWQKMGIPCSHAIATIKKVQKDTPISEYCDGYYSIQSYRMAYEDTIEPVKVLHMPYIPPKKRTKKISDTSGESRRKKSRET
ncbi:hypothetical protein C5167_021764 [Papaver somniferum]|uniref:SWIM-type domain-containing protein n=1 Tax=Papaver somniferum TaxID=3469 RepID=A0A4Y7JHJ8_PAPSO|nr:uncharacterized protein LOC113280903 [Papaver somniferum]RZC60006.1 hypothetical protein C5167_021764 [Papaver somniferum]